MKTLPEIQTTLRDHAAELRSRYGITNLAVFGSVVRGEARENSDVDILADVERSIGLIALCGAENYLTDLLGVKVDLVLRRSVRRELREQIFGEAVAAWIEQLRFIGYLGIDYEVVWAAVKDELPLLRPKIQSLIDELRNDIKEIR